MKKKFTTTLDSELIKQMKEYENKHNKSVAKLIEKAVEQLIKPE